MGLWLEIVIAAGLAILAWAILLRSGKWVYRPKTAHTADRHDRVQITLEGDRITQMSQPAMTLIEAFKCAPNRAALLDHLSNRFTDLKTTDISTLGVRTVFLSRWPSDNATLCLTPAGKYLDISLNDHSDVASLYVLKKDAQTLCAIEDVIETTKLPVWQSNAEGTIIMSNAAFRALDTKISTDLHAAVLAEPQHTTRMCVIGTDNKQRWYDVELSKLQDRTIFYAIDVTQVVKAEQAQRNFVQTLTKTFATLSTGLAIFDRNRQLVLFNPSLVDLTKLPAEFLSTRPNLLSVFDRLRDKHIMPEPKNYATWREELGHLVVAAAEGTYTEVWNLPSGETFRISGRPHPDGALAFLFEDITAEVSKTRKYRSELDFHHALLDQIDTAVAVFAVSGQLCMTNDAHDRLWGEFDQTLLSTQTIMDASRLWQKQAKPNRFWGELRDFVHQLEERSTWTGFIQMADGTEIDCQVIPLPDHHTAVTFQKAHRNATSKVQASNLMTV